MKQFNNFRRRLLPVAALAATIGLILQGCTKVDDTLGGNLIPDNQQMKAGFVTLPRANEINPKKYVETRLFQTDSIVSSNITYGYFGSMLNDTLGRRSMGFLSQMINQYKVDSGYFGYMPIFDSAQIWLEVTSFGRDSITEQSFAVYEVISNKYLTDKPIAPNKSERDSTFYLNFDPVKEGVYDPDKPLFTFTLGGEGKYPSTTTAVTLKPTEAGKKYISRLMLQEKGEKYYGDYSVYSKDSIKQWVEEFKGLYIGPDPQKPLTEYGKGTIFATDLSYSGLSVFGRNRVKDDPSLIKDTIGMIYLFYTDGVEFGNVSVNNVKRDYTEATIADKIVIEQAKETATTRLENPRLYVEGMGGVVTEMTFTPEFFAELEAEITKGNKDGKDFKTLAFSQVRMSVYFEDSDYEWEKIADGTAGNIVRLTDQMNAYPSRLGMYTNYKKLTPISDYAYVYEQNYSTELAYYGKINRSRGCYVMDITGYMQQLWNSYMQAKADAGGVVENIDWSKVTNLSVYIGPEAYSLYTTTFGVLQGMSTEAGAAEPNNAPIRFTMAYNLIK